MPPPRNGTGTVGALEGSTRSNAGFLRRLGQVRRLAPVLAHPPPDARLSHAPGVGAVEPGDGGEGMKVITGVLVAGLALVGVPAGVAAQGADDEAAVLQVVNDLFDGMREKDGDKLRGVWHPEARLQTAGATAEGAAQLGSTPVDGFVQSVLDAPAFLDEVTFDEVVQISGRLATVWAPYNLFVNDAFQHCGVDAIQMLRTADGWKIFQLTDTRTREGCDPERRDL